MVKEKMLNGYHFSGVEMFLFRMHQQLMINVATLVYKIKIKDKHLCDVYQQGMPKDRNLCIPYVHNSHTIVLFCFWLLFSACLVHDVICACRLS